MAVFYLKFRDTLPVLDVILKNPNGTVHNLTGATGFKLHVRLNNGTIFTRTMTKIGTDAEGHLQYAWAAADWDTPTGLIVSPIVPLLPTEVEHTMEYEVTGSGGARLTFPNDSYDTLRILADIGQG